VIFLQQYDIIEQIWDFLGEKERFESKLLSNCNYNLLINNKRINNEKYI